MAKRNRVQFQKGPNGPKLHNMDIRKNRIRSEFESCEGFGAEKCGASCTSGVILGIPVMTCRMNAQSPRFLFIQDCFRYNARQTPGAYPK